MKQLKRTPSFAGAKALPLLIAAALLLCCFPLSGRAATPEGAVFPDWYAFPACGLSLKNEDDHVEEQFYKDAFGTLKGGFLYDAYESGGPHGLCYGIAFVTASVLTGRPEVSSFRSPAGEPYDAVNGLKKGAVSAEARLPLLSLIKYAYVLQASSEMPANFDRTANDVKGLHNAVYDFVYNGGPPVAVGLLGDYSSHEVLAVGLLGDEDIVINDSNDPTQLYVMDFTGESWEYRCAGLSWRSPNDSFDYCTDVTGFYERIIRGGAERRWSDDAYVYDEAQEESGEAFAVCPGFNRSDTDKMLLLLPEGFECPQADALYSLGKCESPFFSADYLFHYVWSASENAVAVKNTAEEARSMAALGNDSGMIVSVIPGGAAAVTSANDTPAVLLKGKNGEETRFAFIRLDASENREYCRVEGCFDVDEAFAVLQNGVLYVTGLRDVKADIEKPGFGQTEKVSAAGGELLLCGSYDEGLTITVMGDADRDGKVTSADARIVLRCSVNLEDIRTYDPAAADMDDDGRITSADARLILRRSVGLKDGTR